MASRFVSGGVIDSSGEAAGAGHGVAGNDGKESSKNAEWEAVQKELEAERKRREDQRIKAASGEEKSLYEILQANKEAKQAAFEEQNKIRNQFRALDDDEINFLEEVRERQKKEDEAKKRELEDGLKAFREARKAEGTANMSEEEAQVEGDDGGESWGVGGRKRKRAKGRDREVKGIKRKIEVADAEKPAEVKEAETHPGAKTEPTATTGTGAVTGGGGSKALGLVGYGSDDSDDE